MLKQGAKAPKIELLDQNGKPWSLAAQGKKKILVYFYPKADTPGCTTQSCALRDIKPDIGRTAIIGISPDKSEKQKKFDDKYELGFPLLADTDKAVAQLYGTVGPLGFPRRSVFVVDGAGIVIYAHRAIAGLTFRPVAEIIEAIGRASS